MITGHVIGDKEFIARLNSVHPRLRAELLKSTKLLAIALARHVKEKKLTGQVLKNRTGTLRRSINSRVEEGADSITGIVGTNKEYAAIHEYGGKTRPHLIKPKDKLALAFWASRGDWVGKVVVKSVRHPGSKMPERSFLRKSLEEMQGEIQREYEAAAERALKAAGVKR